MNNWLLALLTGVGATAVMDLWTLLRKRLLGVPSLDYALVGRWIGHLPRGRFFHHPIGASPAVAGEHMLGWIVHYLTGIAFAAALLTVYGRLWFCHPTLVPALAIGIGSVAAPFFIMQPALGAGIAASRTPRPAATRMHSLLTHAVFGLGLYVSAWLLRALAFDGRC